MPGKNDMEGGIFLTPAFWCHTGMFSGAVTGGFLEPSCEAFWCRPVSVSGAVLGMFLEPPRWISGSAM